MDDSHDNSSRQRGSKRREERGDIGVGGQEGLWERGGKGEGKSYESVRLVGALVLVKEKVKYSWRKEEGGQERDGRESKKKRLSL